MIFAILVQEVRDTLGIDVPPEILKVLEHFQDIMPEELPSELPPHPARN